MERHFDVHKINLGQNTNRPLALRIHLPRHLETIRVRQVRVGRGDGQNDTRRFGDVLHEHVTDLLLDIPWLVADRHFGKTRQVDKGQCEHIGGEDAQVDGQRRDTSVLARLGLD